MIAVLADDDIATGNLPNERIFTTLLSPILSKTGSASSGRNYLREFVVMTSYKTLPPRFTNVGCRLIAARASLLPRSSNFPLYRRNRDQSNSSFMTDFAIILHFLQISYPL